MGNVDNGGLAPEAKYRELQEGPWKKQFAGRDYKSLTAAEIHGIDEAHDVLTEQRRVEKEAKKAASDKYHQQEKERQEKKDAQVQVRSSDKK